jgi:hypothetical protein
MTDNATNAEKRSVSTDALEVLGTKLGPNEKRDAIHLAVEPVIAAHDLWPGSHVGFEDSDGNRWPELDKVYRTAGNGRNTLGIADGFIRSKILKGERFFIMLYPRQITSLRHVWSHPAFPEEPEVTAQEVTAQEVTAPKVYSEEEQRKIRAVEEKLSRTSENWLRNWCAHNDCPDYETVMEVVTSDKDSSDDRNGDEDYGWSKDDERIYFRGTDAHAEIPDEFWDHVENVTGKKCNIRPTYFTCSC